MQKAKEKLAPYLQKAHIAKGSSKIVMNVPGDFVADVDEVRRNLTEQVTHSVRWEQGIKAMESERSICISNSDPAKHYRG